MRRCKEHFFTVGMDPGTGRFAETRAEAASIARFQVHQINLKEGVCRLALTLENEH